MVAEYVFIELWNCNGIPAGPCATLILGFLVIAIFVGMAILGVIGLILQDGCATAGFLILLAILAFAWIGS